MFYYTTSPYTWKNYVHLTGMITTVLSPVYSCNFLEMCSKISEFCINELDENDPFGRNIQVANSPPKAVYGGFLQPRMPSFKFT